LATIATTAALALVGVLSEPAWALGDVGATVETDLSAVQGSDFGSSIAAETDNPNRLLAGSATADGPPKLFISDDGLAAGSSAPLALPATAQVSGGGTAALSLGGAAALAGDLDGNFWVAVAAGGPSSQIYVNRIPAGALGALSQGVALPRGSADRQELPAIAVNDWANGNPNEGKVYAAWVERNGAGRRVVVSECFPEIYSSGCTDPADWTPGNALAAAAPPGGDYLHPDIATAPNGDVYVVWWDAGADNAIEMNRCQAGEICRQTASWDEQVTLEPLDSMDDNGDGSFDSLPRSCPIIAAPSGYVNPSPSVEIDPDGYVFATYSDLRNNADPALPSRCSARGADKTWDSYLAFGTAADALPLPGDRTRVSPDPAGGVDDHFLPALSIDRSDGRVDVTFTSTFGDRSGQTTARRFVSTLDRGISFVDAVAISTSRSRFSGPNSDGWDYGARQGSASAGGVLRAVWTDNRSLHNRDSDLYVLANEAQTSITFGPESTVETAVNAFGIASNAPRIECSVDGAAFLLCPGSFQTDPLINGAHVFQARATDPVGNPVDRSPASRGWAINDVTPPDTSILLAPRKQTKQRRPKFVFDATEPGATWECRYDNERWLSCPRGRKRQAVKLGRHRFRVRAIDVGGNVDPTPEIYKFKRLKPKPKP